jgi:putative addiction module component (TIGR02574 family)
MSPVLKELERKALELSPQEREELADNILRSLDDAPLTAVDEAWVAEAERRYNDFKSGKTQGISGDKVFDQIRRELGWQP